MNARLQHRRGLWFVAMASAIFVAAAMFATAPAGGQSRDEDSSESLARAAEGEERAADPAAASVDSDEVARRIATQTNAYRAAQDLPSLATSAALQKAAQYYADYMARTDRYGHTADGKRPAERAREHGYEFCIVTENIAYQFSTRPLTSPELAKRFVESWKGSPEHRDNMLDSDVTQTGVAIAQSEETEHYYAVQMFGRPQELSIELRVENRSDADVTYELGDREFSLPPRYIRTHQHCRPTELRFQLAEPAQDEGRTESVRVESNASFVIIRGDGGALQVQRKASSPASSPPATPDRQ